MTRALLIMLLALAGCDAQRVRPDRSPPVDAHCDPACFDPCVAEDGDVGVRWQCDPNDSACWDALVETVTEPLAAIARTCEAHRAACEACLTNLKTRRVIQ